MPPGGLRALGLSQAALAGALGLAPNTIARWERGELAIGNPALLRLALDRLGQAPTAAGGEARPSFGDVLGDLKRACSWGASRSWPSSGTGWAPTRRCRRSCT